MSIKTGIFSGIQFKTLSTVAEMGLPFSQFHTLEMFEEEQQQITKNWVDQKVEHNLISLKVKLITLEIITSKRVRCL